MMMVDLGFKRCPKSHIVGRVRKDGQSTALELFRVALDYGQEVPDQVEVIAVVLAGVSIRCSVCGSVISWYQRKRGE